MTTPTCPAAGTPAPGRQSLHTDRSQQWTGLEILGRSGGGLLDSEGTVEFRASWTASGRAGSMHEDSRFVREGGRWVYLTGTTLPG